MPSRKVTKLEAARSLFVRIQQRINGFEDNHCSGLGAEDPYDAWRCDVEGFEAMKEALSGALVEHPPTQGPGKEDPSCCTCPGVIYPCPTVEAIAKAVYVCL